MIAPRIVHRVPGRPSRRIEALVFFPPLALDVVSFLKSKLDAHRLDMFGGGSITA